MEKISLLYFFIFFFVWIFIEVRDLAPHHSEGMKTKTEEKDEET